MAENLARGRAGLPPLVDHAGERGVKIIIENCVMEGWHPDGYPGNLAYSPELWEWMFSLGLYLNYDPSHLMWMGIDPVEAVRPYVDRIPHAQAKDIETVPRAAQPIRLSRQGRRPAGPVGRRLVALPGARPRRGRLAPARSTRSTRAASTACCRSSTRTRSGAAPRTVSNRLADRPPNPAPADRGVTEWLMNEIK